MRSLSQNSSICWQLMLRSGSCECGVGYLCAYCRLGMSNQAREGLGVRCVRWSGARNEYIDTPVSRVELDRLWRQ